MSAFWAGRKVLVTGHTGFKGSWMSLWLASLKARVVGYAVEPPTAPSLFRLAEVDRGIESVHGDVRDLDHLSQVVRSKRPEVIFHLAAQALVRESYRDPVGTYATNVLGTVNLLESARASDSVRAVVVITSDKCYEHRSDGRPYAESDPMGGSDPYGSSKGCAELVMAAYRRSFFSSDDASGRAAVASARAGNVIGGGDWAADRLAPDCIRALLDGRDVVIRNPDAVRPWQHVLEPIGGYLLLAQRLCTHGDEYAGGWNFGPDLADALPVRRMVDRLAALWGEGARWVPDAGAHPYEAPALRLDCDKSRSRLGWRPRLDVEKALRWVVDWHVRLRDGEEARALCLEQIGAFMDTESRADEP